MALDFGDSDGPPTLRVARENEPHCAQLVYTEGDRDVLCDLPAGHAATTPCSAPVPRTTHVEQVKEGTMNRGVIGTVIGVLVVIILVIVILQMT
jgi:hypothetical protein